MTTPPAPTERIATFLHAVRSSPISELREALAHSEAQALAGELPKVTEALAEAFAIVRRRGILPVMRQVEDTARRTVDPLRKHANQRPDELSRRDAAALQLLVEWCAVGLLVVEDLSEAAFRVLWDPFSAIVARRLQDARDARRDLA